MITNGTYTPLPLRVLLEVSGPDRISFLQGLVTQDVSDLAQAGLKYSALLSPQGKVQYDFFVFEQGDTVCLDIENMGRAEALLKRLSMFKLRKNITLKIQQKQIIAAYNSSEILGSFQCFQDPRHSQAGYRIYAAQSIDFEKETGFKPMVLEHTDRLRISLGLPDGIRDIEVDQDTVAEVKLEELNGVSFTKGCYMGQELTSRMYLRNLGKKSLQIVRIHGTAPAPFTDLVVDGALVGDMRSHCGDVGLAMLRHDSHALIQRSGLEVIKCAS